MPNSPATSEALTPVALASLLRAPLERSPTRAALLSIDERLDFAEVELRSDRLAANLLGLGLRAGDRVASLMPNRPALLLQYLACLKAGLVATPLNYRFAPPEILDLQSDRDAGPRAFGDVGAARRLGPAATMGLAPAAGCRQARSLYHWRTTPSCGEASRLGP